MPQARVLRSAAMPERGDATGGSPAGGAAFRAAVAELEAGIAEQRRERPEVGIESEPPPRRLAPRAAAVAATVTIAGEEVGWGRFVLLHDPAGQPGWEGPFRVIAYLRAELEPEIAADPLIGEVGWSWLTEALDARSAGYAAPSGTVTRVVTEGFGSKSDEPTATEFEMRASWSPVPAEAGGPSQPGERPVELHRHVGAWVDALCVASGLPPVSGVAQFRLPQHRQPRQGGPPAPERGR